MADDVVYGKVATIERCLERIREDYVGHEAEFAADQMRQDAIVLNLLRACEAAIDLAMHVVRVRHLGLPERSRDAFDLMEQAGLLDATPASRMRAMVGLRNIAVHAYQTLDLDVVQAVLNDHLEDFTGFNRVILALDTNSP